MIKKYKSDSAFNATEDVLFVPIPVESIDITEGFAAQVIGRFAIAGMRLQERSGLKAGEVLLIGSQAGQQWEPMYSLALCAIHRRASNGWHETPNLVRQSLDAIQKQAYSGRSTRVATAGIPGTGFSGLKGGAAIEAVRDSLDAHELPITVYQDNTAGDRAPLATAQPTPLLGAASIKL